MRQVLIIHQGFPGQFGKLANWLNQNKLAEVFCIGLGPRTAKSTFRYSGYSINRQISNSIHPLAREFEAKVIRAESCGNHLWALAKTGYAPDLVYAHPGWGEPLLVKEIWPNTKLVTYQEFFYRTSGSDLDFDPEFADSFSIDTRVKARLKNAHLLLSLEDSDSCISPTHFQKSILPLEYQHKVATIHDGIDTSVARPSKAVKREPFTINADLTLEPNSPLITFVSRNLEPYRGIHSFIRSIPKIQKLQPDANIVIVGSEQGVSYGSPCNHGLEWKEYFLREIEGSYDPDKVHFLGQVSYEKLIKLFQRTDCHIYLTYPFVLSWSLLEAMSCQAPIVASAVSPVEEVIQDSVNGLLVNFFNEEEIAKCTDKLIKNQQLSRSLGKSARHTVCVNYELENCLNNQWRHLQNVMGTKKSSHQ